MTGTEDYGCVGGMHTGAYFPAEGAVCRSVAGAGGGADDVGCRRGRRSRGWIFGLSSMFKLGFEAKGMGRKGALNR